MRVTLHKYITSETWPTFFASLFVSVFIVMATEMLSITELIMNQGVGAGHMGKMIVYLLPDVVSFSMPAACLIAVVLAFLRLSADSEIIALKSCGVSLYEMMPPVIVLSTLGFVISGLIIMVAVPWGNRSFGELVFTIAESKADVGIKERVFCEPFDDVVFYVNSFSSRDRRMKDIFVVDRRDREMTTTIIAERGQILSDPEKKIITVHFGEGTLFWVDKGLDSARTAQFKSYELNVNLEDLMASLAARKKKPREMSVGQLVKTLKSGSLDENLQNKLTIALMEKFSLPLAVFLMGIIGVPLGAQMRAQARSTAIGVSLVVFLIYYTSLAAMRNLCETGALSPFIGAWIPDIFLLVSCVFLLRCAANEYPIMPVSLLAWRK